MVFVFICTNLFADNHPTGAGESGMANAAVMRPGFWSVFHNQAGLAFYGQRRVGVHFDNSYFLKELSTKSLAFSFPLSRGTLAASYTHFGYSKFNEQKVGIAYALPLGKRVAASVQVDYFHVSIFGDYGTRGIVSGEVGIMAQPIDDLWIGVHVFNPTRAKIADYADERMPTIMRFGIGYQFSDKLFTSVEIEKDVDHDAIHKFGLEYTIMNKIFLRGGIATGPVQHSLGVGYVFGQFKADFSFARHQVLGYSPAVSVSYRI